MSDLALATETPETDEDLGAKGFVLIKITKIKITKKTDQPINLKVFDL
ncbi:MAG: hypothetical protein AABY22_19135 [Nanoarchaeota archaeon]